MSCSRIAPLLSVILFILPICLGQCPHDDPTLTPWAPGEQPDLDVLIDGESFLLTESSNLNSIHITNNGRLVIDDPGAGAALTLRVRHVLIESGGGMHVGAETCPYLGRLDLVLWGMVGDGDQGDPAFGRKFIGVAPGGILELHGAPKLAWTRLAETLQAGQGDPDNTTMITLADDVTSWQSDSPDIVIASSDYDMEHAEVFSTVPCGTCSANQVMIQGPPEYTHYGALADGVDTRAEVGILSRNVRIRGEVEDSCYGQPDYCPHFPDRDLFGGQTQILVGFTTAHLSDLELVDMGQMALGNYPVHFHRSGTAYGAYARRLSIHHTSSRCVTIHGTEGALVEDVVGYDSLGHCFFLEDGNERNNTLRHNLGLVTRGGALLPHDRDAEACATLLGAVQPGYNPDVDSECRATSTFWIAHPENRVIDNVAAGSEEFGFFYVFHREPTGPSQGTLPPFHAERSPLGAFTGNTAHSNARGGLSLDRGLKTTPASAEDPREFLALIETGRYAPHEDRDLYAPRVPAVIDQFTSYKNFLGADIRGGDIIVQDSQFADDTIGLRFSSENTLPYDPGCHQEVIRSTFVGRSANFRDSENFVHSYPQRGIEVHHGPILADSCTFTAYTADEYRNTSSAFGFAPNQQGQYSPLSAVSALTFTDASLRLWLGAPGGEYGAYSGDGDQTQLIYDTDGSLAGDPASYLVRADRDLMATGCRPEPSYGAAVCTGGEDFGKLYIYQLGLTPLTLTFEDRAGTAVNPFTLTGVQGKDEMAINEIAYLPVVVAGRSYNVHWNDTAPEGLIVAPHMLNTGGSVNLALCYPSGTTFVMDYAEYDQLTINVTYSEPLTLGQSVTDVEADPRGRTYFWDESARLLYIKSVQEFPLDGYRYCSDVGCQGIVISATIVNQEVSDCRTPR